MTTIMQTTQVSFGLMLIIADHHHLARIEVAGTGPNVTATATNGVF